MDPIYKEFLKQSDRFDSCISPDKHIKKYIEMIKSKEIIINPVANEILISDEDVDGFMRTFGIPYHTTAFKMLEKIVNFLDNYADHADLDEAISLDEFQNEYNRLIRCPLPNIALECYAGYLNGTEKLNEREKKDLSKKFPVYEDKVSQLKKCTKMIRDYFTQIGTPNPLPQEGNLENRVNSNRAN